MNLLFILNFLLLIQLINSLIVESEYGPIEGFQYTSDSGFQTDVFLGIPFAKPPINHRRFEKPEPIDKWEDTLDAKSYQPPCITVPDFLNKNGKEDCLYLNIIRPTTPSESEDGYSVMFFIHGGAFIIGSGYDSNYTKASERVVSKGVIVVTIQYRLSTFGFYTTGDSEALGNYGIWDQIEALRFTKNVIRSFGGNPNDITIFGESAGGGSTSILTLTEEASDLFSKSIAMSGCSQTLWAFDDSCLRSSIKVAEEVGCNHESSKKQKECMKEITAENILTATKKFMGIGIIPPDTMNVTYYNPRMDNDLIEQNHDDFLESYKKAKKKPSLIGLTSQESIIFVIKGPMAQGPTKWLPVSFADAAKFTKEDFLTNMHAMFSKRDAYGNRVNEALDEIAEFYLKQVDKFKHDKYFQLYVELFSDVFFNIASMREALQKHEAGHEVYFYIYDYTPMKFPIVDGTGHAADMIALWGGNGILPDPPLEGDFEKAVHNFADVLTNFAKTGVPSTKNLKTPKVDGQKIPFIHVNEDPWIGEELWPERLEFWNYMKDKYQWDWITGRKVFKKDEQVNREEL